VSALAVLERNKARRSLADICASLESVLVASERM